LKSKILAGLDSFLFPPRTTVWIGWLRIGLGMHVMSYAFSLWRASQDFFTATSESLINRDLSEAILSLDSPFFPVLDGSFPSGLILVLVRKQASELR
jgi:hypothetical protein